MPLPLPSPALRKIANLCAAVVTGRQKAVVPDDDLPTLAKRHRVEGLVAAATADREAMETIVAANLALVNEYRLLASTLDPVRPLFLKGLPLAALGQAQPLLKQSADIDVLVDRGQASIAATLLDSIGYKLAHPSRRADLDRWYVVSNQSVWVSDRCVVELHVRPLTVPFPAVASSQRVDIVPGLGVDTLGDADLYPYLVLHGALSGWFRLKWLVDLYAYHSRRFDRIDAFHQTAIERGAGAASSAALLLMASLFDLPADALPKQEPRGLRIATLSMGLLEKGEPTLSPLGTLAIHRCHWLVQPGVRPAVARLRDITIQRLLA